MRKNMTDCKESSHEKIIQALSETVGYEETVRNMAEIFGALGDPSRMKILLALLKGELCVYHICELTGAKQSATSQHLRKLRDLRIVKTRKSGNQVLYSIADDHIKIMIDVILEHLHCG